MIPSTSPARGGPSVVVVSLASQLAARGIEVTVASTDDDGFGRRQLPLGEPVMDRSVTYRWYPRQTRFYSVSRPLSRWLKAAVSDYDLVHIHALFNYPSVSAARRCVRAQVPYVVRPVGALATWGIRERHPVLKRASLRFVEGKLLARSAGLHWTAAQERQEAPLVAQERDFVVLPDPVDCPDPDSVTAEAFVERYPGTKGRRLVLFCSRIDPKKGLDVLLRAFAQVASPEGVALVVAGSGDRRFLYELQDLCVRLRIEDRVIWTGFLDGDEKWEAIKASTLLVLASHSENFGVAVAEAMAMGKPVVVSNHVAIHEDVTSAGAGLVVPLDPESVAKAIETILEDTLESSRMGANGERWAREKYAPAAIADSLHRFYLRLLKS